MRKTPLAPLPRAPRLLSGGLLFLSLGAVACGVTPAELTPAPASSGDVLTLPSGSADATLGALGFRDGALAADGTPLFLSGQVATGAASAVVDGQDARAFVLAKLGRAYRLAPGTDLAVQRESRDPEGRRYLRLRQLHNGVPVFGAEVVVQVAEGAVRSVHGKLVPDLQDLRAGALTGEQALSRALLQLARSEGSARVLSAPRPVVWVDESGAALFGLSAIADSYVRIASS